MDYRHSPWSVRMATRPPVLLVDRDPETAGRLWDVLGPAGYTLRWVRTGDEGLEAVSLARNTPVVLLDLGLPDMTAVQFGARLQGYHSRPRLIVMAGGEEDRLDDVAAAVRAAATLRKPLLARPLLDAMESTLAGSGQGETGPLPGWVARQAVRGLF
jgi:DNA-binding response OmpR family regulator